MAGLTMFRMSWVLIGLLAVFSESGIRSFANGTPAIGFTKQAAMVSASSAARSQSVSQVTTTRSITVKRSTIYKKKCWLKLNNDKEVSIQTLEMCPKYGYNVESLYVVPEFLRLLNSLNQAQCSLAARIKYPRDYSLSIKNHDEYDVIVVGSGVAGSVLAAKLSDQKDLRVLVLEAGSTPLIESEIPALWANSIGTEMEWNYHAEQDETFGQSLDNKQAKVIRGKCLGGTSALSTMLYDRGMEYDYLKFEAAGLTKWNFKNLSKYYKRSENCKFEKITTQKTVRKYHSQKGYICTDSFRNTRTVEYRSVYTQALKSVNYSSLDYVDEKNHQGFVTSIATIKDGLRVNVARAAYKNANRKYNLKISARSLVKRVLFEGKKAVGVEFENSVGELIQVKCKGRVVLSSGPVGSPKLLIQSGVGPKDLLNSLNIPAVVCNENVGSNLRAHPNFLGLVYKFDVEPIKSFSISEMVFEYLMKHTGPLATIGLSSYTGYIDVDGNGVADVQLTNHYYAEDDTVFMPSQLDAFNFNDDITEQIIDLNDKNPIQIIGISLLRPKNTGKITVKKTDCGFEPVIAYGSLHDDDVSTLVKAIKWVQNLMNVDAFKKYGPEIVTLDIPGGPKPSADSEEYWKYAVKHLTTMNVQMASTCSMATGHKIGVVNEDLSVFGVTNLKVVDSSTLPMIFGSESCAPSMMLAEKASDIIKEELDCESDDDDDDDDDDDSSDEK